MKTPQQIKNIIEEWIKITNAKFEDITQSEKPKQPRLEWIFKINNVMVAYMMEGRSDRITIESSIQFAEEHQKAVSELPDKKFLEFIIEITEPLISAEITPVFEQKQKQVKKISIQSYIDTELLEREKFYRIWDKISGFRELTIKKVQAKFGVKGMTTDSASSSSSDIIYG